MIKFEEVIAVSGYPNLFRMVASRSNGLILEDFVTKKVSFYSARIHQFSPLDSISMYTLGENIALRDVFKRFAASQMEVPKPTAADAELKEFFGGVIKEYDPHRVHAKDIKKAIKWYHQLKDLGFDWKTQDDTDINNPSKTG